MCSLLSDVSRQVEKYLFYPKCPLREVRRTVFQPSFVDWDAPLSFATLWPVPAQSGWEVPLRLGAHPPGSQVRKVPPPSRSRESGGGTRCCVTAHAQGAGSRGISWLIPGSPGSSSADIPAQTPAPYTEPPAPGGRPEPHGTVWAWPGVFVFLWRCLRWPWVNTDTGHPLLLGGGSRWPAPRRVQLLTAPRGRPTPGDSRLA